MNLIFQQDDVEFNYKIIEDYRFGNRLCIKNSIIRLVKGGLIDLL